MNPIFSTGNMSKEVSEEVKPFRFVMLDKEKVKHTDGNTAPYGVVTAAAAPKKDREANNLAIGLPHLIRVHASQCVVEVETDAAFEPGDKVYPLADGKAGKTGSFVAGIAERSKESGAGRVRVHLFHPSASMFEADK